MNRRAELPLGSTEAPDRAEPELGDPSSWPRRALTAEQARAPEVRPAPMAEETGGCSTIMFARNAMNSGPTPGPSELDPSFNSSWLRMVSLE